MIVTGPTNAGHAVVLVAWPKAEFRAVRADIERSLLDAVELAPRLAERLRAGELSEFYAPANLARILADDAPAAPEGDIRRAA